MAKDPAFLFYSSDFLTGTMLMTDEQIGKYIRLLCLQHQTGPITEKHMLSICKAYDADIFSKFQKDESGNYYNVRLKDESDKRKSYSASRKQNALNRKRSKDQEKDPKAYAKHMENENENINEDEIIINNKGLLGEMLQTFKNENPDYPVFLKDDMPALGRIAQFICRQLGESYQPADPELKDKLMEPWRLISKFINQADFEKSYSIKTISNNIQSITQKIKHEQGSGKTGKKSSKVTASDLDAALTKWDSGRKSAQGAG